MYHDVNPSPFFVFTTISVRAFLLVVNSVVLIHITVRFDQ